MAVPVIRSYAWTLSAYDGPATLPAGIVTGDLLVAIHMGLWSAGTPTTSNLPSPTDWSKPAAGFHTATRSYPFAWQVHYQRAASAAPTARTFTVTNPSGGSLYYDDVLILCIDGSTVISSGDPIEALVGATGANPLTLAGITPAGDDRLALFAGVTTGGTPPGLPTGFASITTQADGTTLSWRFASVEADAAGTGAVSATSQATAHGVLATVKASAAASNSATLSASLPRLTASIAGTQTNPGSLSASIPRLTASLSDRLPGETGRTTGTTPAGTPWTRVELSISGDPAVCYYPTARTPGTPGPLIVMGHGAGDPADWLIDGSHYGNTATRNHILDRGWVTVAPLAGGDTFANATARAAYLAAVDWADNQWPVTDLVYYGFSMGAFAGIAMVVRDTLAAWPLRGLVGIDMPWDLDYLWDTGAAWAVDLLEAAYGTYAAVDDPATYPASAYAGLRALLSWSGDDATVVASHGALALNALAGGVADLTLVETSGAHGATSHFVTTQANAWLDGLLANTGTLQAALPRVTGSITGTATNPGTLTAVTPRVTAALTGSQVNPGTLTAAIPKVLGSLTGTSINPAVLAAALPKAAGAISGQAVTPATLTAALPALGGTLPGTQTNTGSLAGTLPRLTGTVSDQTVVLGSLTGTLPPVTGSLTGTSRNPAILDSGLPKLAGLTTGSSTNPGVVSGGLPILLGALTGSAANPASVTALLPRLVGSITTRRDLRDLTIRVAEPARATIHATDPRPRLTVAEPVRSHITATERTPA